MLLKSLCKIIILLSSLNLFAREIDFTWQGSPQASKYQLQLSNSKNFKKPILRKSTTAPQLKTNLPMGQYYYRVRAIDQSGRPGIWSAPVALNVNPYAPKAISPEKGSKYNFFEERNLIEFEWEKFDGKVVYELVVQKTDGKRVFEKKTRKNKLIINDLSAGDYSWKIRAIVNKKLFTPFSIPRFFFVTQTPIKAPILLHPKHKAFLASYRDDKFKWEKDPATKYSNIELEKISGEPEKILLENIESTEDKLPMLVSGTYRWRVVTKEAKNSAGVSSEWAEFTTSSAVVSQDNHVFRLGTGVQSLAYQTESSRAGGITEATKQTSLLLNIYNRWQITKGFSLAFELQEHKFAIAGQDLDFYKNTFLTEFRFGKDDFQQITFLGYREMDQYDMIGSDPQLLSTLGLTIGFGMDGYLNSTNKLRLSLLYYKPNELLQGGGELTADMYELRFSYSHNLAERLWVDWELAYDKVIFKFEDTSAGISRWNYEAIAPVNVKLSYEY